MRGGGGLFVPDTFTGHSGGELHWKIECDALGDDDWRCLALMAASMLPDFHTVEGIPRGGLPFAEALSEHETPGANYWLLADDVWTTGGSMRARIAEVREGGGMDPDFPLCVVAFSRSVAPLAEWCRAVVHIDGRVTP